MCMCVCACLCMCVCSVCVLSVWVNRWSASFRNLTYLWKSMWEFTKDCVFIKEVSMISLVIVFMHSALQISRELSITHVLFNLLQLHKRFLLCKMAYAITVIYKCTIWAVCMAHMHGSSFLRHYVAYLFIVLPAGRGCRVDECWDMPNKHGIEWRPNQHADNSKPHFQSVLRRPPTKSNAQHVWERLEECPGVLSAHWCILNTKESPWCMLNLTK